MKIYTELDVLLDTRYPIVKELTDINPNEYMVRKNNNFKYIGDMFFNYIYKYRQKDILRKAAPTLVLSLIKEVVTYEKVNQEKDGVKESITLYINTYPYNLDKDEIKDLEKIYFIQMKEVIEVEMIYEKPNSKSILGYDTIVIFDGMWLIDNGVAYAKLSEHGRPGTHLICAASIDDISDMNDYEAVVNDIMNTYEHILNIQMVGVNMFSGVFLN